MYCNFIFQYTHHVQCDCCIVGVLTSHPLLRDIHIKSLSITFHGVELLSDTQMELNSGRRYGLVGLNGSGTFCRSERMREREGGGGGGAAERGRAVERMREGEGSREGGWMRG